MKDEDFDDDLEIIDSDDDGVEVSSPKLSKDSFSADQVFVGPNKADHKYVQEQQPSRKVSIINSTKDVVQNRDTKGKVSEYHTTTDRNAKQVEDQHQPSTESKEKQVEDKDKFEPNKDSKDDEDVIEPNAKRVEDEHELEVKEPLLVDKSVIEPVVKPVEDEVETEEPSIVNKRVVVVAHQPSTESKEKQVEDKDKFEPNKDSKDDEEVTEPNAKRVEDEHELEVKEPSLVDKSVIEAEETSVVEPKERKDERSNQSEVNEICIDDETVVEPKAKFVKVKHETKELFGIVESKAKKDKHQHNTNEPLIVAKSVVEAKEKKVEDEDQSKTVEPSIDDDELKAKPVQDKHEAVAKKPLVADKSVADPKDKQVEDKQQEVENKPSIDSENVVARKKEAVKGRATNMVTETAVEAKDEPAEETRDAAKYDEATTKTKIDADLPAVDEDSQVTTELSSCSEVVTPIPTDSELKDDVFDDEAAPHFQVIRVPGNQKKKVQRRSGSGLSGSDYTKRKKKKPHKKLDKLIIKNVGKLLSREKVFPENEANDICSQILDQLVASAINDYQPKVPPLIIRPKVKKHKKAKKKRPDLASLKIKIKDLMSKNKLATLDQEPEQQACSQSLKSVAEKMGKLTRPLPPKSNKKEMWITKPKVEQQKSLQLVTWHESKVASIKDCQVTTPNVHYNCLTVNYAKPSSDKVAVSSPNKQAAKRPSPSR